MIIKMLIQHCPNTNFVFEKWYLNKIVKGCQHLSGLFLSQNKLCEKAEALMLYNEFLLCKSFTLIYNLV